MTTDDFLHDFAPAAPPDGLRERVLAAALRRERRRPHRWPLAAAAVLLPLLVAANALFESWTDAALGAGKRPAVAAVVPAGAPQPLTLTTADSWHALRASLGGDES